MWFFTIFKVISGGFSKIVTFFTERPVYLLILLAFICGIFTARYFGETKSARELTVIKNELQLQKVISDEVTAQSKLDAEKNAQSEEKLKEELNQLTSEYQAKLEEAVSQQKIKIVKVKVPGISTDTDLIIEGTDVSCRRLPSTYRDQVNALIQKGGESVK